MGFLRLPTTKHILAHSITAAAGWHIRRLLAHITIQLRPNIFSLTPIEVANAIAAAKQASANVLIAQQQVHAAKENVLLQQRIAAEKESQAEILRQKTESAAAIQRSEAAAAAQGVSIFTFISTEFPFSLSLLLSSFYIPLCPFRTSHNEHFIKLHLNEHCEFRAHFDYNMNKCNYNYCFICI